MAVGAWQAYRHAVHGTYLVAVVVLTVGLGLLAWRLEPTSSPVEPKNTELSFLLGVKPAATSTHVTELLTPRPLGFHGGDSAKVLLTVSVDTPTAPQPRTWTVYAPGVTAIGLRPCDPNIRVVTHRPQGGMLAFTEHTNGGQAFNIVLCWARDGPAVLRGPYLSAVIPAIVGGSDFGETQLERDFVPPDTSSSGRPLSRAQFGLAPYALQGTQPPTAVSPGSWTWRTSGNGIKLSDVPLSVSAVDLAGVQDENRRSFLAGVLFGVAGGALIAVVEELLTPVRRRRRRVTVPA